MQDLDKEKGKLKSCLNGFLTRLHKENKKRLVLTKWRAYFIKKKETSSKVAYACNKIKRMKMKQFFDAIRKKSHARCIKHLEVELNKFR